MAIDLFNDPSRYGINKETLLRLDGELSSEHFSYLDLADSKRHPEWTNEGLAVIQNQGNALLYLLNIGSPLLNQEEGLQKLILALANRSDARFLAIVHPGKLDFYPLQMVKDSNPKPVLTDIPLTSLHAFLTGTLSDEGGNVKQKNANKRWLDQFLFELLTSTAKNLRKAESKLSDSQVLSLIGRALFTRFIADRKIICDADASAITNDKQTKAVTQLFSTPENLANTCAWLDLTFNGNLLDILGATQYPTAQEYEGFFKRHKKAHEILSDVLHNAPDGQRQLGWELIKFQHVPADMLSQVYEHFAHKFQTNLAKTTSIHYTPRKIAQQLVNAAFAGSELTKKSQAHILDPSVGAAVFLVLGFKRLVAERWRETGRQPKRDEIRKILHTQLCGLDINQESLKFAALSLYLTALELDPKPTPLKELKFKCLDGEVLRFVGDKSSDGLGSLHEQWAKHKELCHRFDLVVGNPPWTKPNNNLKLVEKYTAVVRACAEQTGLFESAEVARLGSDKGKPDPVFVWRTLDWLKPDGMMAFALHAQHMLFEHGRGYELRRALLKRMELTGVLNGSALRGSKLWPSQSAPFCLWVARNRVPNEASCFYYLNPYLEIGLAEREQYRLDMHDAMVVQQSIATNDSYAFKALSKGDNFVWQLLRKLDNTKAITLGVYLRKIGAKINYGYQTGKGGELEKTSKLKLAKALKGLPMLDDKTIKLNSAPYSITVDELPKFSGKELLYRGSSSAIYKQPLLILEKSPKVFSKKSKVWVSWNDVAHSEEFLGISLNETDDKELHAKYLQLLLLSDFFTFILLMKSAQYGVEREKLHTQDIQSLPVMPIEQLTADAKHTIERLSLNLDRGGDSTKKINNWVAKLYGLTEKDASLIKDVLATESPFESDKKWSGELPQATQGKLFAEAVTNTVLPFAKSVNIPITVSFVERSKTALRGWWFLKISFTENAVDKEASETPAQWLNELSVADQLWASQVQFHTDNGQVLWIGLLAQNRYWTISRAHALAQRLLHEELGKHVPSNWRSV